MDPCLRFSSLFSSCQARPRHLSVPRLLPLRAWPFGYLVLHPHLPILSPHPHFPFSHTPINIAPFSPFPLTAPRPGQRALLCSWRRRPRNGRCLWGPGLLRLHLLGSPLLPPLRSTAWSSDLHPSDVGFWGAAGRTGVAILLTSTLTRPSFFGGDSPLSRRVDPLRVRSPRATSRLFWDSRLFCAL